MDASAIGQKPGVSHPLFLAEAFTEDAEEAVVACAEQDVTVRSSEAGVGNDGGWMYLSDRLRSISGWGGV